MGCCGTKLTCKFPSAPKSFRSKAFCKSSSGDSLGEEPCFQKRFSSCVQARCGRIPLSGRYHRRTEKNPKSIEDDYQLCDTILGTGANGLVRMAIAKDRVSSSTQTFAVKAFRLSHVSLGKREQLDSEVEVFLVADHPHITRLYDVYECDENLFLVMECCEGGELFDRVSERKAFCERDAADALFQMLLSLNYLHNRGIVHRDVKLSNFLYDKKESNTIKLIDFGFSKMSRPNSKLHGTCGTLSYIAPEVLKKNYTSQCDLWSLGVITFVLLSGRMPFSGCEASQKKSISEGLYSVTGGNWKQISNEGLEFTKGLLQVNPDKRLTAQAALAHPWIAQRQLGVRSVDADVALALRQFGHASKFRRCCLEMMAWSLSAEERNKVHDYFISIDANRHGTIILSELRDFFAQNFIIENEELIKIFNALDSNNDEEIHYSDFLAAMLSRRIALHDGLLRSAFKRFDTDSSGFITLDNLREVIGDTFEGVDVDELLAEGDLLQDGRISYAEFVAYIKETPLSV